MKIWNSIGWCDATINAVIGCDKVSEGCKFCYASVGTIVRVLRYQGRETWGPKGERVPVNFAPVFRKLNKLCVCNICHEAWPFSLLGDDCVMPDPNTGFCDGDRRRIRLFADSNSDWLDRKWEVGTRFELLRSVWKAPNIDTILLTKRIENFETCLVEVIEHLGQEYPGDGPYPEEAMQFEQWLVDWTNSKPPAHVWLGVSVENQKCADERIPKLRDTPAAVRFLSVEPLLEDVDVSGFVWKSGCEPHCGEKCSKDADCPMEGRENAWVIVGGESGAGRRDCGVEAIVSVHDQCVAAGVPVYVKQASAFKSGQQGRIPDHVWKRKEFPNNNAIMPYL